VGVDSVLLCHNGVCQSCLGAGNEGASVGDGGVVPVGVDVWSMLQS